MANPQVLTCMVADCAYNKGKTCHAGLIIVGDILPCCDSYTYLPTNALPADDLDASEKGSVGTCKVETCTFNENLTCNAPGIEIDRKTCNANCLMFKERLMLTEV